MKKLVLMAQLSLDGYIADKNGNYDWLKFNWDQQGTWDYKLKKYFTGLTSSVDCILLCPAMENKGYVSAWAGVAKDINNAQSAFAKNVTASERIIFSSTLNSSEEVDTDLVRGEISTGINKIKKQSGKNIVVHGGATFARALIGAGLIDEFQLFVNPKMLGDGINLFKDRTDLKLLKTRSFPCGVTLLKYRPLKVVEPKNQDYEQ
jgi:dihydrofolate reductase